MLNVLLAVVAWFVIETLLGLGNTVGYHRMLTHRSFKAKRPVWVLFTLLGALHGGSPMVWVAIHRLHHTKSDMPEDPHSPRNGGFWHAHSGWLLGTANAPLSIAFALSGFGQQAVLLWHDLRRLMGTNPPVWRDICPDLREDPLMRLLDVPLVLPALFGLQLLAAWLVFGPWGLVWLWAMHLVLTNGSWAVNSICHWPSFGVAPFDAGDDSRDVWWMALITYGEGFHNAHHRYPKSARHGLAGGFDVSWFAIRLMERLGLVTDVWLPKAYRNGDNPATAA